MSSSSSPVRRQPWSIIGPFLKASDRKWRVAVTPLPVAPDAPPPPGSVHHVFDSESAARTFVDWLRSRIDPPRTQPA